MDEERKSHSEVWYRVWVHALSPSLTTHRQLTQIGSSAPLKTPIVWMSGSALLSYAVVLIERVVGGNQFITDRIAFFVFGGFPFTIAVEILKLVVAGFVANWLAGLLGGKENFRHFLFLYAAFWAPLTIISTVAYEITAYLTYSVIILPAIVVHIISLATHGYKLWLSLLTVKAKYELSWTYTGIIAIPLVVESVFQILFAYVI